MSHAMIVENLSHNFAEKQVLNHISFEIAEGEVFGLLGPSGAGKTTFPLPCVLYLLFWRC